MVPPKKQPTAKTNSTPEMLVLDASYTLEVLKARGTEHSVLCRDLDGFFGHVWSVHPFATLLTSEKWTPRFGKPVHHSLAHRHTFIEGKVGRFEFLRNFPTLNFLIGQILIFVSLLMLIWFRPIKIIRVGDPLYLGLFGLALSRLTRVPLVIRVNGNNEKIRQNTGVPIYPKLFRSIKLEKWIERFVFPRADLVAAPNQDNVDFSIAAGASPDRVTIFRYGNLLAPEHLAEPSARSCDTKMFDNLGIVPRKFLLCVGRLQPVKFPDDAIRILSETIRKGFEIKLVFAGDGEMLAELKSLAFQEGVQDCVVFAGNQNQQALAQLNTFASAVISPLTGRALSESALCGAPIVAYDLDWQGDLITSGETGALVPFREWQRMADAVEEYLRKPEFAARMGRNARVRALLMLDPKVLDQHEREQYSKLLRNHARS